MYDGSVQGFFFYVGGNKNKIAWLADVTKLKQTSNSSLFILSFLPFFSYNKGASIILCAFYNSNNVRI